MALSKGIGVRFSELKDNHEDAPYWWWSEKDVRTYTRFGVLAGGESFGVARTPSQENSYARDVVIVSEDGEVRACGWIYPDGGVGEHFPEPEVMVASPSSKTIVWLGGGAVWVWLQDKGLQRIVSGNTKRVPIPDDAAVLDARMNEDGTLDLWCEGGVCHVYSCEEDVLVSDYHAADLRSTAKGHVIVDLSGLDKARMLYTYRELMESCLRAFPEVDGFLVGGDAAMAIGEWELCNLPVRELRFAPEVEHIEEGAFAGLDGLERVVIPATVQMVESGAFGVNGRLTDLVIEGNLTRVANWHEDAFEECPCEAEYLELRRKAAAGEL